MELTRRHILELTGLGLVPPALEALTMSHRLHLFDAARQAPQ
ncbi:hypothetical protein ACFV9C_24990 [Kribbella sp. NPDC059898]